MTPTTTIETCGMCGATDHPHRLFAIWWGAQCVANVRAPKDATDQDVRTLALRSHDRVPLCDRPLETPDERRSKLLRGDVKRYNVVP